MALPEQSVIPSATQQSGSAYPPKPYTVQFEGFSVTVVFSRPSNAERREAELERTIAQALQRKQRQAA